MMVEHGISHREIEELVLSPPEQARFFDRPSPPAARMEAVGSAQFTLALAAVESGIRALAFETRVSDPMVLEMMGRVRFQTDVRLSLIYPKTWPAILGVCLRSGERIESELLVPPGDPSDPLTGEKLPEKFESLTSSVNCPSRTDTQIRQLY